MPVLKNPKYELFAQGLAKGVADVDAHEQAGYKRNAGNASRLKRNENIQARVDELLSAGSERAEIDIARTLSELGRVGFSDLRRVFTPNGGVLDPQEWDDDTAASISSVEVVVRPTGEKDENGRNVVEHTHKIRVWDKVSALEKIGKHLKMFTDVHEHTGKDGGPIQTEEVSARERIAGKLASLAARGGTDGDTEPAK